MRILFFQRDIYLFLGGGETVYKAIIEACPTCDFFYFIDKEQTCNARPLNAHPIALNLSKNTEDNLFYWGLLLRKNPAVNDGTFIFKLYNFFDMIVGQLKNMEFDIIDIPDFMLVGDFLRTLLEKYNIKYKKIVSAAHGRVSHVLLTEWISQEVLNLEYYEKRQMESADAIYGISERYINNKLLHTNKPTFCLDPMLFVKCAKKVYKESNLKPQLACVGRKIRCKGADIFVEILSWISPELHSGALVIGPDYHTGNGLSGDDFIQNCASNRGVCVQLENSFSQTQLFDLYGKKTLLVLPVRYDSFNLVALEALFSGCPVAISDKAGVCDYLDRYYPEIPYIKIHTDHIYDCVKEIEFVLKNYDSFRKLLNDVLRTVSINPDKNSIGAMYKSILALPNKNHSQCSFPISSINQKCCRRSDDIIHEHWNGQHLLEKFTSFPENSYSNIEEKISLLEQMYSINNSHIRLDKNYNHNNLPVSQYCCNYYMEFSRLYDLIELPMISLVYDMRIVRLLGFHPVYTTESFLARIRGVLDDNIYNAAISQIIHLANDTSYEKKYFSNDYIEEMKRMPQGYEPFECKISSVQYQAPLVSVIISTYNSAYQLDQCLQKLNLQTFAKQKQLEVIVIDSHSLQDEKAIVLSYMDKTNLNIIYARTKTRETIQRAWNRGILLSNAKYITELGTDETFYPDGIEKLYYAIINGNFDWVMSNSLLCSVNSEGLIEQDITLYDYSNANKNLFYSDKRYIRWCGGIYKKELHDKFGYYDDSFKIAGCTEFAYRVLPYINVKYMPETLGAYTNFPTPRASQPESTELEYYRVSFLFRTYKNIHKRWENRSQNDILTQIIICMGFRRCTFTHMSTDVKYAMHLAKILFEKDQKYEKLYLSLESINNSYTKLLYSPDGLPSIVTSKKNILAVQQDVNKVFPIFREFFRVENHLKIFNDWMFERYNSIIGSKTYLNDLNIKR